MKFTHKLSYIALGGLLMLIGMIASSIFMPNLFAQRGNAVNLGDITCTQLRLVDSYGRERGRLYTDPDGDGVLRLTDKNSIMNGDLFVSTDKGVTLGPDMLALRDSGKLAILLSTISVGPDGVNRRALKILKDDGRNSACFLIGDDTGGNLGVFTGGKFYSYPSLDMILDGLNTNN